MRVLDLFAGIGGFSLAAHWMGWETVGFVEWDDFCQKVLKKNFPGIPIWGDIKDFNKQLQNGEIEIIKDTISSRCLYGESEKEGTKIREQWKSSSGDSKRIYRQKISRPDIITGGFPCQPFSHAGKRKGTDDSRYLWPEMLTTIRTLKPSFVVGENVAGLVSMENGKTLERIFADLENEGYTVESFIIPACSVGAWHRRDRIWIIGYSESQRSTYRLQQSNRQGEGQSGGTSVKQDVPNTECKRGCSRDNRGEYAEDVGELRGSKEHGYWDTEPELGRVAHGIPNRVDRLKGLGNAIVPQIAFELFRCIDKLYKDEL